jgi:hypothetical protein
LYGFNSYTINYILPHETTETLIVKGLIKDVMKELSLPLAQMKGILKKLNWSGKG